jgi:hypothetical protein
LGIKDPPRDCFFGDQTHNLRLSTYPLARRADHLLRKSRKKAAEGVVFSQMILVTFSQKTIPGSSWQVPAFVINCICDLTENEGKIAALVFKRLSQTGHGK